MATQAETEDWALSWALTHLHGALWESGSALLPDLQPLARLICQDGITQLSRIQEFPQ